MEEGGHSRHTLGTRSRHKGPLDPGNQRHSWGTRRDQAAQCWQAPFRQGGQQKRIPGRAPPLWKEGGQRTHGDGPGHRWAPAAQNGAECRTKSPASSSGRGPTRLPQSAVFCCVQCVFSLTDLSGWESAARGNTEAWFMPLRSSYAKLSYDSDCLCHYTCLLLSVSVITPPTARQQCGFFLQRCNLP